MDMSICQKRLVSQLGMFEKFKIQVMCDWWKFRFNMVPILFFVTSIGGYTIEC
jgi:hypothetical protein